MELGLCRCFFVTSLKGAEGPGPVQRGSCRWAVGDVTSEGSGGPFPFTDKPSWISHQGLPLRPETNVSFISTLGDPCTLILASVLSSSVGNERSWLGTLGTEQGDAERPGLETELTVTGRLEIRSGVSPWVSLSHICLCCRHRSLTLSPNAPRMDKRNWYCQKHAIYQILGYLFCILLKT